MTSSVSNTSLRPIVSPAEQQLATAARGLQDEYAFLQSQPRLMQELRIEPLLASEEAQAEILRNMVSDRVNQTQLAALVRILRYVFHRALPALKAAYPNLENERALLILDEFDYNLAHIRDENVLPQPLSLWDFCPINCWEVYPTGRFSNGEPKWIRDCTTGNLYLNDSTCMIRVKCFLAALGTPILHLIGTIYNIAFRLIILCTFYRFWIADRSDLNSRCTEVAKDTLRLIASATLLPLLFLELSALYGLFNPRDGRKLYSSFERATYGDSSWRIAPCFRPLATSHFLGGNISQRDAL